MATAVKPLSDRILIQKREEQNTTKGGIIIPETAQDNSQIAWVLEVGPGKLVDGKLVAPQVRPGDRVIYSKYAGTEVKIEGENCILVREDDILAVLA